MSRAVRLAPDLFATGRALIVLEKLQVIAGSTGAAVHEIAELAHETRAELHLIEPGAGVWAVLRVSPMTDNARSVFPLDAAGLQGDTRRQGQAGVMLLGNVARDRHALAVVIERAARMFRAEDLRPLPVQWN